MGERTDVGGSLREVTLRILNPSGLHARPAAVFVRGATGFHSEIRVANLSRETERDASAKSVIGVLGLGVSAGDEVRIRADGEDAEAAIAALVELIEEGLGEARTS